MRAAQRRHRHDAVVDPEVRDPFAMPFGLHDVTVERGVPASVGDFVPPAVSYAPKEGISRARRIKIQIPHCAGMTGIW